MAKVPHVTKNDIEEYLRLDEERKSLNRQAKDLEKLQDVIEKKLDEFVRANGGKTKSVSRSGFVLALLTRKTAPKWKEEFIRVAGPEEAERLAKQAPDREYLTVERVA
jgi:seryl-tRNA synthetase